MTTEANSDDHKKTMESVRILNDELIKIHLKFKEQHQLTAELHSTAKECLKSLKRIDNKTPITDTILQEINIGKTVAKFRKALLKKGEEPELCDLATHLIDKWTLRHRMKGLRETLDAIHKKWKRNGQNNGENRSPCHNDEDAKTANEALQKLGEMRITLGLLSEKPKIGSVVKKFEQYDSTRTAAKLLIDKWSEIAKQITGPALQALTAYRKREQELAAQERKKPDMIAFKELRSKYLPSRRKHGKLQGVPFGIWLNGRGEAAILGIHQNILSGIDSVKDEACYAVCISGKYEDEDVVVKSSRSSNNDENAANDNNDDGTILYTGSGGQKNGRQVENQIENPANASLIRSSLSGQEIRVLRRKQLKSTDKPEYWYEGLYTCTGYKYEPSSDGPKVYKFVLKPIEGESQRSSTALSQTSTRQGGRMNGGGQVRDRLKRHF